MRLGVLVSGRGSNLRAVLEAVADGRLRGVEPVLVISNRPGVAALEIAATHAIPTRDGAIGWALAGTGVDLALLAGYDALLRAPYFEAYSGRTINIHPSLLPAHGGRGMVGRAVHAAVLAAGDVVSGVTIHDVTRELDAGPVVRQQRVPVLPGDVPERLEARILATEHRFLVETLGQLAGR
jgi:phosphoribosylglycinamide formyltransferase-1